MDNTITFDDISSTDLSTTGDITFTDGTDTVSEGAIAYDADADQMLIIDDASSGWVVTGDSSQWIDMEVTGSLSLPNCTNGQIVVYQNDQLTCINQEANMNPLTTVSGILTIVIITIIVSKWIVPKINWKTLVRGFFHLIYKPVKKESNEVLKKWENVKGQ